MAAPQTRSREYSSELQDAARAKMCGVPQFTAALVIIGAISGSIAWSVQVSGYDTSDYNWVDNWRMGIPRFMGVVLFCFYTQAVLYNHLAFVDFNLFAKPCADPNSKETAEERWAHTPTEARGAAVSCGGWCVANAIILGCMPVFEPGCQRGLCIAVIVTMVWWQIVWYGAMWGRVDADDEHKLPAKNWILAETLQELVIICLCSYFVFFVHGTATSPASSGSSMDTARVVFIRVMCTVLSLLYGSATLFKHTMFITTLAPAVVIEGSDPNEIWSKTPTAAKHSAVESGGWGVCVALTLLTMTILEPGCEKGLCKCWFLVMVWWNCVWYTAMYGRIDFNDSFQRPWTKWFKGETIQEIFLGVAAFYLGFIAE